MNLALIAAAATGVQVGAATVASRFLVGEIPPLTLALLRYTIGAACLVPVTLWLAHRHPAARPPPGATGRSRASVAGDWCVMALLGIGQFGLLIAALNYGLKTVDAARAAMIFSLSPLMTLLLSAALGRERLSLGLLGGVMLAIAGVVVALAPKMVAVHAGSWIGEIAVLVSAAISAVCSVLYRPYLQRYPVLQVSSFAMVASVLFLAVAALSESWPLLLAAIDPASWGIVVFIGLSSAVGYWWWLYALRHESATRVTVFLALNPLTAAALGHWLLHEPLDRWIGIAVGLIAAGLWLATRTPPPMAAE
jgi:drug/metabolite transporter (DMT)-like permease